MDLDYETIKLIQQEFQNDFVPPKTSSDSFLARQLQKQFEKEAAVSPKSKLIASDSQLAKTLQEQFEKESLIESPAGSLVYKKNKNRENTKSLVDPSWEVIDPTPDIHVLFMAFNMKFFWGKLDSVCVSWSKRMKRCAGVCSYHPRGGLCSITLSEPLLKLRPRKDLVETLLHEMIHAFLFVTHNNRDRDGHGPEFHKHMYRINGEAGTNITVYHDFHDEVDLYLQHWWRCDGPCQKWKPYFGIVRRSMNRAPGPNDRWWGEHSRNCGGTFSKIKSPEPEAKPEKKGKENKPMGDIRKFLPTINKPGPSKTSNINTLSKSQSNLSTSVTIPSKTNNIHGFTNSATKSGIQRGATKNASSTIVINPKTSTTTKNIGIKIDIFKPKVTNESGQSETLINYDVVRNHWVQKYSNSETNASNKRKSSMNSGQISKSPKLQSTSSSKDSSTCPVCNKLYPIVELNEHLDICLKNSENMKECVICSKMIKSSEYDQHIDECLTTNFKDDEDDVFIVENKIDSQILIEDDSMDGNEIKCNICNNIVLIDNLDEHLKICKNRNECPECKEKINPEMYDMHLHDCLIKKFDKMDGEISDIKVKKQDDVKVDCLACGASISRDQLNSHLDECLNTVFKDDMSQENVTNDDVMFNCPICLKLIAENVMNEHIDVCLKMTDSDAEVERNKSVFLNEFE